MFSYNVSSEIQLKLLQPVYAEEIYEVTNHNRDHLREWLPWVDNMKSADDTKQFIESELQKFSNNNGFNCGMYYNDKFAGCIGFHELDWRNRKTSIGYWLAAEYQGLGIVTSACREMITYAFAEYGLNRIEIRAGEYNTKSRAVPERLGFTYEGSIRQAEWLHDRCIDHAVYGLLASEWKPA
ncbi:GNAT family protein [Paenibacillus sp. UMB4589-SE434]|uniref:GNAT family N-acetyltransferase n=1 Tax=Paenibacillus sp. UMB4589-SE434 TaxID=3046314 RepID=UPI00254D33A4|nr:GNAT family protein [Paenibacillus sp. UMB4589-SE434]MDK8182603.1 GNAT family protein [Paenibacillus sp. UMB4589-SE434]